jgi:cytoskeleton protein RodZ
MPADGCSFPVAKTEDGLLIIPAMPTVAEQLRHAREVKNLTVYQVAEITKIKTDHVRALDTGDYDVFSAPVYIRGFVRTYASLLKLDLPEIMAVLDQELAQTVKFREPPSLGGGSQSALDSIMFRLSKVNWRIILPVLTGVLLVFLGIWGYRAYQSHQAKDPLQNLGPGTYQPIATGGDTLPLPTDSARK